MCRCSEWALPADVDDIDLAADAGPKKLRFSDVANSSPGEAVATSATSALLLPFAEVSAAASNVAAAAAAAVSGSVTLKAPSSTLNAVHHAAALANADGVRAYLRIRPLNESREGGQPSTLVTSSGSNIVNFAAPLVGSSHGKWETIVTQTRAAHFQSAILEEAAGCDGHIVDCTGRLIGPCPLLATRTDLASVQVRRALRLVVLHPSFRRVYRAGETVQVCVPGRGAPRH